MNTCPVCMSEFKPKRKEQVICSLICRQKKNATGRRGQRTGMQTEPEQPRMADGISGWMDRLEATGDGQVLKPSNKWTERHKALAEWQNKILAGGRHVTTREMACFEDGFEAAREALSVCADGGKYSSHHDPSWQEGYKEGYDDSRLVALDEAAKVAYAHSAIMATTTAQLIEKAIRALIVGKK